MASIRNNKNTQITISYVAGKGLNELSLLPGVNFNIPDKEIENVKKHPIFNHYLERGDLDILNFIPSAKGELEGFQVTEDKKTDEPIPILEGKVKKAA